MNMNISYDAIKQYVPGDVFQVNGKTYKLLKKTTTAVAVERYYWWDAAADWVWRTVGSSDESKHY